MIKYHWDGSYNSTKEFMGNLPWSYKREKARVMKALGVDTIINIQQRISSGTTGPGLSELYLKWKKKHNLLPGVLTRTSDYKYHIRIEHSEDGFNIYPFGMAKTIAYTSHKTGKRIRPSTSRKSYEEIAVWLEHGTRKMPPRPHWMPAARRANAKFPGAMRVAIQAAFDRARSSGMVTSVSGYGYRE